MVYNLDIINMGWRKENSHKTGYTPQIIGLENSLRSMGARAHQITHLKSPTLGEWTVCTDYGLHKKDIPSDAEIVDIERPIANGEIIGKPFNIPGKKGEYIYIHTHNLPPTERTEEGLPIMIIKMSW